MQTYNLPQHVSALIFDMDSTLYSNEEYGRYQIDCLVARAGVKLGKSFEAMQHEVARYRKNWAASHNGEAISLSPIFASYGISMEENIRWRNELYKPEAYLSEDRRLQRTLKLLSQKYVLGLVTNNTTAIAGKTLAIIGVTHAFTAIIGLDTYMKAKPGKEPFLKMAELLGVRPDGCVSIGDRFDIDLKAPLDLGMGGILVSGVEDVYALESLLLPYNIC
ncbi:HAD family hydrolase [Breznakiellaceae bacterium SP9]